MRIRTFQNTTTWKKIYIPEWYNDWCFSEIGVHKVLSSGEKEIFKEKHRETIALRNDSELHKMISSKYEKIKEEKALSLVEPKEPIEEEIKPIVVDTINGFDLILDPSTVTYTTKIGWVTLPVSVESFASIMSELGKSKKIISSFSKEVSEISDWTKLWDRILLWWPTGSGKTMSFHNDANEMMRKKEVDYIEKMTITEWFEDLDFLAYIVPQEDGGIKYVEREIISILREASKWKKVAVCLDELNRWSRSFMNFILTLLDWVDWDHYVLNNFIKDEKILIPIKNVLIYATMNLGSKYSGTSQLDEALMDRFNKVKYVSYNLENEKAIIDNFWEEFSSIATTIISYIRELHSSWEIRSAISTRGIKMWAENFINTLKTKEDFYNTFASTLMYRLVNVDDYGSPNNEEILLIMKKFKELGIK